MKKDLINVLVNVLPIEDYDEITSYIASLEKGNQKYKEVIDKLKNIHLEYPKYNYSYDYVIYKNAVNKILEEVK